MRVFRIIVVAALCLPLLALGAPAPALGKAGPRPVKVMTRNLYLGADLSPVFSATSLPDLLVRAAQQYQLVQATDFPARAKVLAREIAEADPVLIGLQEASLWRRGEPGVLDGPATPATTVVSDYLQILLDELAAQGHPYTVLVAQFTTDGELPTALGYDVRLTQRNAILAKAGLPTDELVVSAVSAGLYATYLTIPTVGGPVADRRGWVAVDVTVNRRSFRFVNTHLDSTSPLIGQAQAGELLAGPTVTSQPVILVGDLNSTPDVALPSAYATLRGAGFVDAWTEANPSAPGLTCCHAEDLRNPTPTFDVRLDYVLTRPGVAVARAKVVGIDPDNRTPSGLWPADHAGVVVTLRP
jgi:endonuclease/exonuclease/phosphatase family metal-dependent hydrolase